ncbi:MAG: DUF2163 domain-containing protein [Ahrensia sp.]|nr:DUF2163 domain-containing protein [Ahrensia sp.]
MTQVLGVMRGMLSVKMVLCSVLRIMIGQSLWATSVCEPNSGFTAGAAEAAIGLSADISQVEGALSSQKISRDDIELGKYDRARIIQFQLDWNAPEDARVVRHFHMGEITVADDKFVVELRSISSQFDQIKGRYFRRDCDADLGDHRCQVDMTQSDRRVAASIQADSSQSPQRLFVITSTPIDYQNFNGGKDRVYRRRNLIVRRTELPHVHGHLE